ncbi:hypothetical protein ASPCADRAFT_206213 [Aspergillus carbonarius ITEM 5010]|uniref:Uncharacterized protein n=1 Tax=Aspergillus carbonarius (strain ITEM 5010) TaxID=602072 RepID=A0A1R3RSB8_ASPC5|nr:hypothetical protein ASPCADRAFT_206213 [Aspergillus carbonarius ITEM 5010]
MQQHCLAEEQRFLQQAWLLSPLGSPIQMSIKTSAISLHGHHWSCGRVLVSQ